MYIGRFAPTPSGPLHFGSIIAALGSYLDARKNSGRWLVRLDDLDDTRVKPGACDTILNTLERLGLFWDGEVLYQSTRTDAYQHGLEYLKNCGLVYPCRCSRNALKGIKRYPGTCRNNLNPGERRHALRLFVNDCIILLEDRIQGNISFNLAEETGDFVLLRSDNIFAYQLASVIDDDWQMITHIVRGADLIESTICQIYLQTRLDMPAPEYCHLPVAVKADGRKISKTNRAQDALLYSTPEKVLLKAMKFLGFTLADELENGTPAEIIQWGIDNWDLAKVPSTRQITVNLD